MSWKAFRFYIFHPIIFLRRIGNFIYELRHPDEPWLSPGAVRFLDQHLRTDMNLFEWGSGRSTLWFAQRVQRVVSIEYHEGWAQKVNELVGEKQISNVDLRYIPVEHPLSDPTPKHYPSLPKYVAEIHKFQPESIDVIVVDGHYRLTCVDQCLQYIRSGGYLVIDNSNRDSKKDWAVPTDWPLLHESSNVMTQTSIWRKP